MSCIGMNLLGSSTSGGLFDAALELSGDLGVGVNVGSSLTGSTGFDVGVSSIGLGSSGFVFGEGDESFFAFSTA